MVDSKSDSLDKLEKAIIYATLKICEEVGKVQHVTFSTEFVHTLGRLAFRQTCLYAEDLENFAKHAKRSTVNADDLKLLLRKKNDIMDHVNKFFKPSKEKDKVNKKKRNSDEADLNFECIAGPSKIQKLGKKKKKI